MIRATIYNGKLFRVTFDNHLVALDMKTGDEVWNQKFADKKDGYYATGAPVVANGVLISGMAGGKRTTRGFLDGGNLTPGRNCGGVTRFLRRASLDRRRGRAAPMPGCTVVLDVAVRVLRSAARPHCRYPGNQEPYDRHPRGGLDSLFTSSVLAIRPKTGEVACHYQYTPNDVYDVDGTDESVLADIQMDGRLRKVMIQANKNGILYVLDRTDCSLIAANPYIKVNWATHIDLKTGRPVLTEG